MVIWQQERAKSQGRDGNLRDIVRDHCRTVGRNRMGEQVGRLAREGYAGLQACQEMPLSGERYTERQVYDWCGLRNRKHWTKGGADREE